MEKQTKIIIGVGLVALAYYLWKNTKSKATTTAPVVIAPTYPAGLKENDYILIGTDPTVYVLKGGEKLPATYDWMTKYAADKWNSLIKINAMDGMSIPTGTTLTA
jgi:hypothetical protein